MLTGGGLPGGSMASWPPSDFEQSDKYQNINRKQHIE